MKVRFRVIISGRVQGVNFRSYTIRTAEGLGLAGRVRNLPDGRVEAIIEGEEPKVRDMIESLEKGPPGSKVENIDIEKEKYRGEFWGFKRR